MQNPAMCEDDAASRCVHDNLLQVRTGPREQDDCFSRRDHRRVVRNPHPGSRSSIHPVTHCTAIISVTSRDDSEPGFLAVPSWVAGRLVDLRERGVYARRVAGTFAVACFARDDVPGRHSVRCRCCYGCCSKWSRCRNHLDANRSRACSHPSTLTH